MPPAIDWSAIAPEHRKTAKNITKIFGKALSTYPTLNGIEDDAGYEEGLRLYESLIAVMPDGEADHEPSSEVSALLFFEGILGQMLADYAAERWPAREYPGGTAAAILRVLMDENGLKQVDLPEIGSQGVVSELLAGKREFNVRQIKLLSERFGVPSDWFLKN